MNDYIFLYRYADETKPVFEKKKGKIYLNLRIRIMEDDI